VIAAEAVLCGPSLPTTSSDPEYCTTQLEDMLRSKHGVVEIRHSNEHHQQFQNALVEKCVDSLGKMIRAMLLQSPLPPEFWGCAAMLATDLANCRPHNSPGLLVFPPLWLPDGYSQRSMSGGTWQPRARMQCISAQGWLLAGGHFLDTHPGSIASILPLTVYLTSNYFPIG
jgi:hypothetical protein